MDRAAAEFACAMAESTVQSLTKSESPLCLEVTRLHAHCSGLADNSGGEERSGGPTRDLLEIVR